MNMRFSHLYEKFGEQMIYKLQRGETVSVRILHMFKESYDNLSDEFIYYDTKIYNQNEMFQLYKGDKIIFIMQDLISGTIFTTIRPYSSEYWEYYSRKMSSNELVNIEVTQYA